MSKYESHMVQQEEQPDSVNGWEHLENKSVQSGSHFRLKDKLRSMGNAILGLSMLLGGAEKGYATEFSTASLEAHTSFLEGKTKAVGLPEILRVIEHGTNEQAYVCGDLKLSQCYPIGESMEKSITFTAAEVLEIAGRQGWEKVVLVHTHNLHDYEITGVAGMVEGFEQNGISREAIPPSGLDFISYHQGVTEVGAGGVRLVEAVAGTTGIWEYSVQNGVWSRALNEYNTALNESKQLLDSSTGDEAHEVKEVMANNDNILNYISALAPLAKTNTLAKKIRSNLCGSAKSGQNFEELVTELEWRQLALGILRADSSPLVLEAARRSFISYARSLGIKVSFTSYAQMEK